MPGSLSRQDAFIEIMTLMAAADGTLHDDEATQLALTIANRSEFGHMSEDDIGVAVAGAFERIEQQSLSERLAVLSASLPDELGRFKATVFAYSILVADGVIAPGETRCLRQILDAFKLTAPVSDDRPRVQKRAERTRQRILEAGMKLFSSEGYHATSSKKIAKEAGVAIGSFYNYFDDKKALLVEVFHEHAEHGQELLVQMLAAFGSAESAREVIHIFVSHVIEAHTDTTEFVRESALLRYSDADICRLYDDETQRFVQTLLTGLEPYRDGLRVPDLGVATYLIAKATEEIVHSLKLFEAPFAEAKLVDGLVDMACRYLFEDKG